jgi:hypothetical protein
MLASPVRSALLTATQVGALGRCADTTGSWPVGSHVWGQYAEQIEGKVAVCRTENVSACHAGVADLVEGPLGEAAAEALGEPASAFKDKIT